MIVSAQSTDTIRNAYRTPLILLSKRLPTFICDQIKIGAAFPNVMIVAYFLFLLFLFTVFPQFRTQTVIRKQLDY